ncbi:MAG: hypothetical protein AB7E13_00685 [Arcobacteraceae bacterium]|jgi:hypothetical protein
MHSIRLNIPDLIYSDLMSFLKKYPNSDSYIVTDEVKPDFIVSSIEEARQRVEEARGGEFIEEKEFWKEIDEHISKI